MALQSTIKAFETVSTLDFDKVLTWLKTKFTLDTDLFVHSMDHETVPKTPHVPAAKIHFFVIKIAGSKGKLSGNSASRTLGVIGRSGGVGSSLHRFGMVSDADGVVAALATAFQLKTMQENGIQLNGDVIISAHFASKAPFLNEDESYSTAMPARTETMNYFQVTGTDKSWIKDEKYKMDAILSIDTSKGNRLINHRGIAISPTAKQGYILRASPSLIDVMEAVTGKPATTFPITQMDITPYHFPEDDVDGGKELPAFNRFNSIMQPSISTDSPVVGVAITAQSVVAGAETTASREIDIAEAVQFCIEVAKRLDASGQPRRCHFFDEVEFKRIAEKYSSIPMEKFQTIGQEHWSQPNVPFPPVNPPLPPDPPGISNDFRGPMTSMINSLHLTAEEKNKLIIAVAAMVASQRKLDEVPLNYPETMAIIINHALEQARRGSSVEAIIESAQNLIRASEVMQGVDEMIKNVYVEATFPEGTCAIVIPNPVR